MKLTEKEKKILVMRGKGEDLKDIANHFGVNEKDIKNIFEGIGNKIKTVNDSIDIIKVLDTTPYEQSEAKSRRILDDIPKYHLVKYAIEYFPDDINNSLMENKN